MSLAAWMPSSLRFFSICFDLAREALSSADMAHPILPQRPSTVVVAAGAPKPREPVRRKGEQLKGEKCVLWAHTGVVEWIS